MLHVGHLGDPIRVSLTFLELLGGPSSYFRFIFDDFRASGAHVRTALSLQFQHDLEGSGGVQESTFLLYVVFGRKQKCISENTFMIFVRFLGGKGSHLEPQMASKLYLKSKNLCPIAQMGSRGVSGCHRKAF